MAKYSDHAISIYKRLYFLRDNDDTYIETTPEETHERVCRYIATNDEEYERFKYMFDEQMFRCNTPCFLNAGIKHKNNHDGNLCACFVVGLEDSLLSIAEMYKTAMLIYSSGAGMGAEIGVLREKGGPLSTGGFSSGPISFMKVIQELAETVRSGGRNRRAANFFGMMYNHPDILDFITCKQEYDLSAMNISVMLNADFFDILDADGEVTLVSPTGHERGKIKASTIWEMLVENAWDTADPGCFFVDNVNKYNKTPSKGEIRASNPCLPAWAPVKTPTGYKYLSGVREVSYQGGRYQTSGYFKTKDKATVYEIKLQSGLCIYATENHPILTQRGYVEVKDLDIDTDIVKMDYTPIAYELKEEEYGEGLVAGLIHTRGAFIDLFTKDISYQIGFINGYIFNYGKIESGILLPNVKDTNTEILKDIQIILSSLGIYSELNNIGLLILDIEEFNKHLTLINPSMQRKAKELNKNTLTPYFKARQSIQHIKPHSEEPVYDLNVPGINCFVTNGAIVHNCSEVPLREWSTCNLGSINVYKFVHGGSFDFKEFAEWVPWGVRFLDNVISKTAYINNKFKKNMLTFRPIGLGIMGFADTCYELGIRYDSKEGIHLLENISQVLTKTAYEYSIDCVTYGEKDPIAFPAKDIEHFTKILKGYGVDKEHIDRFLKYGIRNTEVTCFAPTGSTALSADASYSFEPVFGLTFKKTLVDTGEVLYITNKVFEKHLDEIATKSGVSKEQILEDIASEEHKGSIQKIDYIPQEYKDVFVVAHDIDPKRRVEIQGKAQKYISMAISSTINLPNSATKDDVAFIYRLAHEEGLKGITIYRDGSKDFQPIEFTSKDKEDTGKIDFDDRPIIRYGKTIEVKTSQGKLFLTGNYIKNELKEVFIRLSKQGTLVSVLTDALARCISKGLQHGVDIQHYIDTLIDLQGEPFWTRLTPESQANELVYSIPDAIAKILLYHFSNGKEEIPKEDTLDPTLKMCPSCNRRGIKPGFGGCKSGSCIYCGYSACGG